MEEVLVIQHHRVLLSLRRAVTDLKPITYHTNRLLRNGWQCQLRESMSPDDEYRSSRNIAISLFRRYRNFVERGGGDNLKEFISAGVNAYALGCTDEGLRNELTNMKESGTEIEAMQSYGGSTSLRSKIFSEEIDECILWLSIIFITILCTPQPTIVRWSSTSPVSDEITLKWKGFCAIIANAYFMRGMAWLPVKTLQLEQMAVVGYAEEPSVVASRMRIVFSTLEVVSPQWPRV
ncbi:Crossover junction endonuclease [Actinidia chinensis var. chinensis]|uniref:Crossover junction endonuclease n=1 Tax=Actinidia chinensis var. chinensis TaxID=1590841 RepID=A0A2R6Q9W6_ACTCC|nr:Crossover junction endonuclease [Actinidia chinensis var. chinensis]